MTHLSWRSNNQNEVFKDLTRLDLYHNVNPILMNQSLLLKHYLPFKPLLYTLHKCLVGVYLVVSQIKEDIKHLFL